MEPLALIPNLIEQVHLRLVDAIADGTLAPGERLTQEEVAQRLSVSRQPVSHALQLLKRQGLAVEIGKRGLAVAPVEPNRMRDLYQVRGALDGLAARLAAERVSGRPRPGSGDGWPEASPRRGLGPWRGRPRPRMDRKGRRLPLGDLRPFRQPRDCEIGRAAWPHFKRSMGASLIDPDTRARRCGWSTSTSPKPSSPGTQRRAAEASVSHTERAGRALYDRLFAAADAA